MGEINMNLTKQEVVQMGERIREKLKNIGGEIGESLVTKDIAMIENAPGTTSREMINIARDKVRHYNNKVNISRSVTIGILAASTFLIGGGFVAPSVCPDSVAVKEISKEVRKLGTSLILPTIVLSNLTEAAAKDKKQESKRLIQAVEDNSGQYLPENDFDMTKLFLIHTGRKEMEYILKD